MNVPMVIMRRVLLAVKPNFKPSQPMCVIRSMSKDYTGPNRLIPNPLTQDSKSLLLRPGYQLNDKHYVGGVYEITKQNYAMQDKTVPAYLTVHDIEKSRLSNHGQANGYYQGNNLGERIRDAIGANSGYGINYAHGVFYDEKHQKTA